MPKLLLPRWLCVKLSDGCSRGDPEPDRARAGRTGAPRNGRQAGAGGAPGGAAPYVTGRARFTLPREVGTLFPPQGCPLVPWRLPPLHPPRAGSRGILQTSDALRRENKKPWLFESVDQNFTNASTQIQRVGRNKRRVSDAHCAALREERRMAQCASLIAPYALSGPLGCAGPESIVPVSAVGCRTQIPWLWIPGSREERAPE
jgi:hypothetical protein